jgi:hypothetical protein
MLLMARTPAMARALASTASFSACVSTTPRSVTVPLLSAMIFTVLALMEKVSSCTTARRIAAVSSMSLSVLDWSSGVMEESISRSGLLRAVLSGARG